MTAIAHFLKMSWIQLLKIKQKSNHIANYTLIPGFGVNSVWNLHQAVVFYSAETWKAEYFVSIERAVYWTLYLLNIDLTTFNFM